MQPGTERFPKSVRLRTRREFVRVQEHGEKVSAGPFLALVQPNSLGITRLGITVSSKVGGAVLRGRIRRRVRELFRKGRSKLPQGLDLVVVARGSAREADFGTMAQAFEGLVRKLARSAP